MKIVSGGQTGVDRAALDVAMALGLEVGGWCPRGRLAEDGPIEPHYPLRETPLAAYRQRTEWNVRDSDGTLVLTRGAPAGGTGYTLAMARRWDRPALVVDIDSEPEPAARIAAWLVAEDIAVLNVAGPRDTTCPGIAAAVCPILEEIFQEAQ